MIKERLYRGFHRIGLVLAIPCGLGAVAAAIVSLGLFIFPTTIGPLFGIDAKDVEVTTPSGASFSLQKVLAEERRGNLSAERQALLDEARRRGLVPVSGRSETNEAALVSLGVGGVMLLVGLLWYAAMRTIAWVLAGFFG